MSEEDLETIAQMEDRGGSFVKALANAARFADPDNLEIIKVAFAGYWQTYRDRALVALSQRLGGL